MSLKIHPGIGVARIGQSVEFAIAPETIEIEGPPTGGYRDAAGLIRRLGARFRVFEHDGATPAVEIVASPTVSIRWTVKVGVTAGSSTLPFETNEETIIGVNQVKVFETLASLPGVSPRGELRTDPVGRLIVLSALDPSPGYDGRCSGWVRATVNRGAGDEVALESWVLLTAPDFAPGRRPVISFYDRRAQTNGVPVPAQPSFRTEILPILRARNLGRPLSVEAGFPLLSGAAERQTVAGIDPSIEPDPTAYSVDGMTNRQWHILAKWIAGSGNFIEDWPPVGSVPQTWQELDRGPLSHCIAGSGTWEITAPPSAAFSETVRLPVSTPLGTMTPSVNWLNDLGVCVGIWVDQVESPEPLPGGGGDLSRGFMVLQGGTLEYVERLSRASVLLETPSIDMGVVPLGPGGEPTFRHAAIIFEVQADDEAIDLDMSTPPPGLFAFRGTSEHVGVGQHRQVKFWITYLTGAPLPTPTVVQVTSSLGRVYSIAVTATTGPYQRTQVAMVLDCSLSMADDWGNGEPKLTGLKRAAKAFIDVARQQDGLGIVPFSSDVLTPLVRNVTELGVDRSAPRGVVDGLSAVSYTSIGDGLARGRELLDADTAGTYAHSVLVVVTDGKENEPQLIADVADRIDQRTFAVGIGQPTDIDAGKLQTLTGNRGGYLLVTGTPDRDATTFTLEKFFMQLLAGINQEDVILDPDGTALPGAVDRIPFPVTEAELSFEAIVLCRTPKRLRVELEAPDGTIITPEGALGVPGLSYREHEGVRSFRAVLPVLASPRRMQHAGEWALRVSLAGDEKNFAAMQSSQRQSVAYAATINARSALSFRADVVQPSTLPGSPVQIEATLSAFGGPWRAEAASVQVTGPDGLSFTLPLVEQQLGRYAATFEPVRLGLYRLRIGATGRTPLGQRFRRELAASASVVYESQGDPRERPEPGAPTPKRGICEQLVERALCRVLRLARRCGCR